MKPRFVLIIAVVAALAVGAVFTYGTLMGPSAKDRIEADPPPTLFSAAAIKPVDAMVDPQAADAHRRMKKYWSSHGTRADDKAFATWLQDHFPKPPKKAARLKELPLLTAQSKSRTKSGVAAATWLEVHGKKDIWKLYAHDQAEWLPAKAGDARKGDVKAMLKLTKKVAAHLDTDLGASTPYVLDPALWHKSTDHPTRPTVDHGCPCSYPSHHAAKAAAVRTYLSAYQPHMTAQYRWMEDEVDWSRIYMAGHVPSDIAGGALLGDMIGEYYLVTRGHQAPKPVQAGAL